jgi:hypothetical protein
VRAPRWALAIVFAVGFGHAALYAVTFPPWAIEDEQQHVDYAWKIAYDHRLPSIDDRIDYGIVEGVFGTDRFEAYGMARPEPTAESMGLQARSYTAYHPPAAYVVVAPVVLVSGGRALLALYLLRLTSALAAGAVAATTAALAVDVVGRRARGLDDGARAHATAPDPRLATATDDVTSADDVVSPTSTVAVSVAAAPRFGDQRAVAIALAAGLAMAALPALADSGGRVNADIFATLIVVVGCRVLLRWVDQPTPRVSWWLGALLAVAALTRETALVLAIPVIVATASLLRSRRLDGGIVARSLVPPLVASFAWIGYQWRTSGHLDGSRAFLETYGDVLSQPPPRPLTETIGDALLVPFGTWGVPWLLVVVIAAVATAGLVLLARSGSWVVAATAAGMLAFIVVAMALAIQRDLNIVTARLLLPAYPAVIAAATVGWSTWRNRWSPFVLTIPVVAFGVWFAAFELLARFSPRLG